MLTCQQRASSSQNSTKAAGKDLLPTSSLTDLHGEFGDKWPPNIYLHFQLHSLIQLSAASVINIELCQNVLLSGCLFGLSGRPFVGFMLPAGWERH